MIELGYYTNPKLAEERVQYVRQGLDTLDWLDRSYPIVHEGNDGETYPMVYVSGEDSYDIRPSNDIDSYCFFEFYGADVGDNDDLIAYDLSVSFWVDLKKLGETEDKTWNIISDVIRILKDKDCYNISVSMNPFDSFSFELDKSQLMRQYSGWKINFTIYGLNAMCAYE